MDLIPYLSTVILVATVATIVMAVSSYGVFKLRDRRRPSGEETGTLFFRKFRLDPEADEAPEESNRSDSGTAAGSAEESADA